MSQFTKFTSTIAASIAMTNTCTDAALLTRTAKNLAQKPPAFDRIWATGNKMKIGEVKNYLKSVGLEDNPAVQFENMSIDLPELQGRPEEIAAAKAHLAYKELLKRRMEEGNSRPFLVFTEDTSFAYKSFNDLPGPYIKWFLKELKHEGLWKLLAAYEDKTAYAQTIFAVTGNVEGLKLNQEDNTLKIDIGKEHTYGSDYSRATYTYGPSSNDWEPEHSPIEKELINSNTDLDFKNGDFIITFSGRTHGQIVNPVGRATAGDNMFDPVFAPIEAEGKTYAEMEPEDKTVINHRSRSAKNLMDFLLANASSSSSSETSSLRNGTGGYKSGYSNSSDMEIASEAKKTKLNSEA